MKIQNLKLKILLVQFLFVLFLSQTIYLNNANATHTSTNRIINDLALSLAPVGPAAFRWTGAACCNAVIFIGTNPDPIVGSSDSVPVTSSSGYATWGASLPAGQYFAAMYTGAFGEVLMSNILSFSIGGAGGPVTLNVTSSDSNVTFNWGAIPGWPNGSTYFLGVYLSTGCPLGSTQASSFPVSFTSASGGTHTWTNAPTGSYSAALYTFAPTPMSTCPTFSVEETVTPPLAVGPDSAPFSIKDFFSPARIFSNFGQLATDVVLILTSIASGLVLIFVVIAGIKFVTSSGDPKKIESARSTITYAIIGIAVVILAFVIVRILQFFLRSNVPIT